MERHLKNSLCVVLSWLLAFSPTVAFARPAPPAKSRRFEAVSKTAYQKKLAHEAAKKPARKANAAVASTPPLPLTSRLMTGGEALKALYPTVRTKKNKDLIVLQEPGVRGKAKRQIIRGADFEEILLDERGTGTASVWEVTRGDVTFTATNPLNGKFTKLTVEDKRKGAVIKTKYYLNADAKTYRLAKVDVASYEVDHYAFNNPIACTRDILGSNGEAATSMGQFEKLLKELQEKTQKPADAALKCKLQRMQNLLFDSTCTDGDFKASMAAMTEGLAIIMTSRGTTNPGYLQCIEDRGFALNSAKLQGVLSDKLNAAMTALKSMGYSDAELYDDKCEPITDPSIVLQGGRVTVPGLTMNPFSGNSKLFRCDSNIRDPAENVDGLITLGRTADAMPAALKHKFMSDPAKAYAEVMTHELLHSTGLKENPDEALVSDLQECCADPTYGKRKNGKQRTNGACADVDDYADKQYRAQIGETLLSGMGPGYDNMENAATALLGDQSPAFMRQYLGDFMKDKKTARSLATFRACFAKAGGNADAEAACAQPMNDQLLTFTQNFVHDECPSYAKHATTTGRGLSCDSLRDTFTTAIRSQIQMVRSGNVPAAPVGGTTISLSPASVAAATDVLNGGEKASVAGNAYWKMLAQDPSAAQIYDRTLLADKSRLAAVQGRDGVRRVESKISSRSSGDPASASVAAVPSGPLMEDGEFVVTSRGPSQPSSQPQTAAPQTEPVNGLTLARSSRGDEAAPAARSASSSSASVSPAFTPTDRGSSVSSVPTNGLVMGSGSTAAPDSDSSVIDTPYSTGASSRSASGSSGSSISGSSRTVSLAGSLAGQGTVNLDTQSSRTMPTYQPSNAQPGVAGGNRADGVVASSSDTQILNGARAAASSVAASLTNTAFAMGDKTLADALESRSFDSPKSGASLARYTPPPTSRTPARNVASAAGPAASSNSASGSGSAGSQARAQASAPDKKSGDEDDETQSGAEKKAPTGETTKPQLADKARVDAADVSAVTVPTPATQARLDAVAKSPEAKAFPNATSLAVELRKDYSTMRKKLRSQQWWDLMSLRGVQVRMLNGPPIGASKPKVCMSEAKNPLRFIPSQCAP